MLASTAILLGIAIYSALELDAEFPGTKTITAFRDEAKDTYQDVQQLDIPSAVNSFTDGTTESDQASDPAKRHLELKHHTLDLTNEQRLKAGAPPVKLGPNPAAQLHAEAAVKGLLQRPLGQVGSKAQPPIHSHGRHRCRWRKCQRFQLLHLTVRELRPDNFDATGSSPNRSGMDGQPRTQAQPTESSPHDPERRRSARPFQPSHGPTIRV